MVMLSQRQQVAIAVEATAGTNETLDATDVVLHTGIAEFEGDPAMVPREAMSASLSKRGSVVGARMGKIRWKQYLRGSYNHSTGAIAAPSVGTEPDFHVPFLGCGLAATISGTTPNEQTAYVPSSTTISDETSGAYCTVGLYEDGKAYVLRGAVGNCVLTFNNGSPVLAEFEFTGVWSYALITDTALLSSVVYPTFVEPAFLSASVSILGYAAKISSLRLDLGNRISMRPNPNNGQGYHVAQIVDRKPVGSIDPEETLDATNAWWDTWILETKGAITTGTFPNGGTNYNEFNLNIPNAQYTKVGLADREGVATAPVEFECLANTAAGEDEFTFTQT